MIKNRIVLNSDAVNRDNIQFPIKALEDGLQQTALRGLPTCIGHDRHRPIGWTVPFGLYLEPGLCRSVGSQLMATNSEDMKLIYNLHNAALQQQQDSHCLPHLDELKGLLDSFVTEDTTHADAGCVCYKQDDLAVDVFPNLFQKADKDGLLYLKDLLEEFTYLGCGVFKQKKGELAILSHQYFRRSLSLYNNFNYYFLNELLCHKNDENITIRIAIDRNLVGLAKTYHDTVELEYWRGPKFQDDISSIKLGVAVYGSSDFQKRYYGIRQSEFWWKIQDNVQTFEAEEVKENSSLGLSDDIYGCRYIHSIFDEKTKTFEHFDGAIRAYDTEKMLDRLEHDIKSAGKSADYTKIFRIDGQLAISDWKALTCHYFQGNPQIHEYFNIEPEKENEPHYLEPDEKSLIERLVPYSLNAGNGIKLLVSYLPKEDEPLSDDICVSGYDTLNSGEIRYIEADIIELRKVLQRSGYSLAIPPDLKIVGFEDRYLNFQTITCKTPDHVTVVFEAFRTIISRYIEKKVDLVLSFNVVWETSDKKISISVFGHSIDVLEWLIENPTIPNKRELFRDWLEKQGDFLKKYNSEYDTPSLFYLAHDDGVLYIHRKELSPDTKYELSWNDAKELIITYILKADEEELENAIKSKEIQSALAYIQNEKICSICNNDYLQCSHTRMLDDNLRVTVTKSDVLGAFWTDRKA